MRRALALACLALAACNGHFEEVERVVGPGPLARRNALLAAERFTVAMGLEAEGREVYLAPPALDYALVLSGEGLPLFDRRAIDLFSWVEEGGHLVLCLFGFERMDKTPSGPLYQNHPVLVELDVVLGEELGYCEPVAVRGAEFELDLPPAPGLVDQGQQAFERSGESGEAHVLRFAYGAGIITLTTYGTFLTNEQLGHADHAPYLWHLVQSREATRGVRLVRGATENLWDMLVRRAWMALLAGAALLALWLWHSAGRFGPLLSDPPPQRREFHEHVRASAHFLWQHEHGGELLGAYRQRVMRAVERAFPGLADAARDKLAAALAERSGLTEARVYRVLHASEADDHGRYTRLIRDLRRIHETL